MICRIRLRESVTLLKPIKEICHRHIISGGTFFLEAIRKHTTVVEVLFCFIDKLGTKLFISATG